MATANVIAVVNTKGGCGKSTLAVNLACQLATERRRTIVVDADIQRTATHYASHGRLPVVVESIPLEREKDVDKWIDRVLRIDADNIVIDSPPHAGAVTRAVVGIADLVLVPVTPSAADIIATASALELVRAVRAARKDGPRCLLVPSRVDRRNRSGREIEDALKRLGEPVAPAVRQLITFTDALGNGEWVGQFAPDGPAHEDIKNLVRRIKQK